MVTRREVILGMARDLVVSFVYYDRQNDEDLPRGEIEAALAAGELTREEIVEAFAEALRAAL